MTNPLFVRRLTDAEKETLQQWLVSEDGERARRAQVILESSSGKTAFEIGQKLGFHPDNLKKWIRKFNQTGLGGIEVLKRGPRSRFTAEQIDKILTLYNKSPLEQGFTFSTWTPQKLAFAAVKKGIVSEISHVTVRQLISKDLGSENISSNLLQENVEDFSVRNGYTGKFDGAKPKVPIWNSLNPLSAAIRSNMTVAELISLGQSALRKSDNEEAARIFGQVLTRTEMTAEQEAQARAGLSEAYEELGESEQMLEVLSIYEEATARSTLPPKFQALVKLRLGWAYSKLSNFAKAIARFNEARPIYFEVDDQEGIAAVYYALGYAYIEINEFDLARSYLLKALENLRFSSDGKLIARIYINLGLVSYVEGDFEGAKVSYLKGQEYTKGLNDPVLHGLISMNLGSVYVNYGKQTEASEYFELAVKEFTRSGQKKYLTLAYNNLGNNLMQCGRWSEATLSLNNALSLARELEDKRNAGLTLVTLGELRFQQGDYERSEEALLSAIEILQDNDKWAEVDAQRVLGRLYFVTNRPEKSLRTLREALQLATRIGNLYEVCLCHLALAEYHFFQEEYKQAEVYLELAKENLKGKHDPDLSANGWAQRLAGKLAMAKQTFEEAKQYISASINIFASINDKYQLASSRLEMGLLCMQIGDFIASREHLTEAQQIFIELGAQTSIARIDELLLSLEKGELPQKRRLVEVKQNDVLLMQRLIEAATSRDILLKELATIIYENFASERVVIFESLNNKPIAPSVFLGCRQIEVDKL
ncbi:MAG: tetratricopeptide repeat protein, partial [Blastocatellia bacterium]|nr:tetratricopeptide repeat protein [Blastocatellia bacterium]